MLRYKRNETDFESLMALGVVMTGRGTAQGIDCGELPLGAVVQVRVGWQEYVLLNSSDRPAPFLLPTNLLLSHGVGAASLSGITAIVGVRDVAILKTTDKILVSGTAGGVGSHVVEIALPLEKILSWK